MRPTGIEGGLTREPNSHLSLIAAAVECVTREVTPELLHKGWTGVPDAAVITSPIQKANLACPPS